VDFLVVYCAMNGPAAPQTPRTQTVLVTGGAGFLGRALLRELRKPARGRVTPPDEIRVFDRRRLEGDDAVGVESIVGDIRSAGDVLAACRGVDVVFHAASLVDYGHASEGLLEAINVGGTHNVIRACREAGVRGLVHTSTMDVVYGARPIVGGDETLPYPRRYADAYARSKALAEQAAIRANGASRAPRDGEATAGARLRTCAIRPCGMYGEADPYHVSSVLRMLQAGRLTARLGDGRAAFQHVYVGNVAHAHTLAAAQLLEPQSPIPGEIYLVTDFPALNFFDFMAPLVSRLGYAMPPRSRSIPYPIAFAVGAALELAAKLCRPLFAFQPPLTRSSVRVVCQDLRFVGDKAARDLGYRPLYSEAESLERTVAWFAAHGAVASPALPLTE
jgi:nucleoside-diphosphate-sugar epimerase